MFYKELRATLRKTRSLANSWATSPRDGSRPPHCGGRLSSLHLAPAQPVRAEKLWKTRSGCQTDTPTRAACTSTAQEPRAPQRGARAPCAAPWARPARGNQHASSPPLILPRWEEPVKPQGLDSPHPSRERQARGRCSRLVLAKGEHPFASSFEGGATWQENPGYRSPWYNTT